MGTIYSQESRRKEPYRIKEILPDGREIFPEQAVTISLPELHYHERFIFPCVEVAQRFRERVITICVSILRDYSGSDNPEPKPK